MIGVTARTAARWCRTRDRVLGDLDAGSVRGYLMQFSR